MAPSTTYGQVQATTPAPPTLAPIPQAQSTGALLAASNNAAARPHFERVHEALHSAWERLTAEAERLEGMADRFLGAVPQEAPTAPTPAPSSILEHYDSMASRLHVVIDRINAARQRLERL